MPCTIWRHASQRPPTGRLRAGLVAEGVAALEEALAIRRRLRVEQGETPEALAEMARCEERLAEARATRAVLPDEGIT
jgi:hypothetical protein